MKRSFKTKIKFARDFRYFNKREFAEESTNIDWSNKINEQVRTEISYQNFYSEIEQILNYTLRKSLNTDLALLYEWLCANPLSLNDSKTEFIVFRPLCHKANHEWLILKLHHSKLFESSKIKVK